MEFPPCSYVEYHKKGELPQSFMFVRSPYGTFDVSRGVVIHEMRAICSDCMMRVWDSILRPKANSLLVTLEKEASEDAPK